MKKFRVGEQVAVFPEVFSGVQAEVVKVLRGGQYRIRTYDDGKIYVQHEKDLRKIGRIK